MKKNVIVTGANGRLGKLVCEAIDERKFNILKYVRGKDPTEYMNKKIHYILHLASSFTEDFHKCLADNISLTNNFLRLAKDKNAKILVIGSKSIFYKIGNYQYSKAMVGALALEYITLGVDVTYFTLPEVIYNKDNIFKKIDKRRKKENVKVDRLQFMYVDGEDLAKEIATKYLLGKNMDVKISECNLYDKFKRKKNIEKGIPKSYITEDKFGIVLRYMQRM